MATFSSHGKAKVNRSIRARLVIWFLLFSFCFCFALAAELPGPTHTWILMLSVFNIKHMGAFDGWIKSLYWIELKGRGRRLQGSLECCRNMIS